MPIGMVLIAACSGALYVSGLICWDVFFRAPISFLHLIVLCSHRVQTYASLINVQGAWPICLIIFAAIFLFDMCVITGEAAKTLK